MKTITLNIGIEAVMNHIYALSALRTLGAGMRQPAESLLTRNEAPALRLVVKDMFVMWVAQAARWVANFDIDSEEILAVTLVLPDGTDITAFRHELERMLAFKAMATALPRKEAEDYEATARDTAHELTRTLAGAYHGGHRAQHWL